MISAAIDINKPAKSLSGKVLANGWIVKDNVTKEESDAKSFSQTYIVEKNGEKALLKALDFSIALLDEDPPKALIQLSKSYNFERELLELCKSERLTRIIKIIDQGNIPPLTGSIIPVPYFILEFAERDVKSQIDFDSRLNTVWLLSILHNVSVGLWQLHQRGVAHKNVKPEHIVEFTKIRQKITELSHSDRRGYENPITDFDQSYDPAYLTPEFLYGHTESDWVYNSQAADVYQLGNLIFFLFTQSNFNTWLFMALDHLHPNFRPGVWGGTFKDVLPYLEEAYDWAIKNFFGPYVDMNDEMKSRLELMIRQMCHPDPLKRGHPKSIASIESSMSVQRFVNEFARMKYDLINSL
jgi:serine/threonine protein kinase